MRLVWRREPNESGLRSIGQSERGKELRHAGETVGLVKRYQDRGDFYWTGEHGAIHYNSLWDNKTYIVEQDAMDDLKAWYIKQVEGTCK